MLSKMFPTEKYKVCSCQGFHVGLCFLVYRGARLILHVKVYRGLYYSDRENSCITSSGALEELCQVCENSPDDVIVPSVLFQLGLFGDYQIITGSLSVWSLKAMCF